MSVGFISVRPNPVHREFMKGAQSQLFGGWFMGLAKSKKPWLNKLHNRFLSPASGFFNALLYYNQYDYIVVPDYGLVLGAWIKRISSNTKLIYFNYSPFFYDFPNKSIWKQRYFRHWLKEIDGMISASYMVDQIAKKEMDVPSVVSYPYGGEDFVGVNQEPNAKHLIVISSLHKTKGIVRAIEVYRSVRERLGSNPKLFILGDGPMKKELASMVRDDPLICLLGHQPLEVVQRYLAQSFVLLQLCFLDAFPVSVLEAGSVGVFPVVSDSVGSSEVLPPELTVGGGEAKEAVEKVMALYRLSPELRAGLRNRVKEIVSSFCKERQVADFRAKFWKLLEQLNDGQD